MKGNYQIILLFTFIQTICFGQNYPEPVVQINNPINELYIGFQNKVYLSVSGLRFEDLELKSKEAKRIVKKEGYWLVNVGRIKNAKFIVLHKGIEIYSEKVSCQPLSDPKFYLGSVISGSTEKIENIIHDPYFNIRIPNSNTKMNWQILETKLTISIYDVAIDNILIKSYNLINNCLTTEIIKLIESKKVLKLKWTSTFTYNDKKDFKAIGVGEILVYDVLKKQLNDKQNKVRDVELDLNIQYNELKLKDSILKNRNLSLGEQREELEKNQDAIVEQQTVLDSQKTTLSNQFNQINEQKTLLIIFVIISLIITLLLAISYINYNQKKKANIKIVKQKEEIEEAHKEITDSIDYAKRIQNAILPPSRLVKEYFKESFILYKPKDIVAGDFYWMEDLQDTILFAAADCTGHGVPGAMVSVVCHNAMNRSVREYGLTEPGQILVKVRELVIEEFEKSDDDVKDGMDIALCSLKGNQLKYSGAHNPLWIIRNGEILETKANKEPIGKFHQQTPFITHSFELEKGDTIYIFSDGYVDQFGGEREKKFKPANLRKLLLSIQDQDLPQQRLTINQAFEDWKGDLEQVDDVCMIGVRIS